MGFSRKICNPLIEDIDGKFQGGGGRVKAVIEFQGGIPKFEKEFPDFYQCKKVEDSR